MPLIINFEEVDIASRIGAEGNLEGNTMVFELAGAQDIELRLTELDQGTPAGRFRLRIDGDQVLLERLLTLNANGRDWSTYRDIAIFDGATGTFTLAQSLVVPDSIRITSEPAADAEWSGITANFQAGEAIAFAEVVYVETDGDVNLADADLATTSPAIGIATAAIANAATGEILTHGFVRNDAWAWTVGGEVYLSNTPGALTQTAPVGSGDQVQVLGIATHADRIFFSPSLTVTVVP